MDDKLFPSDRKRDPIAELAQLIAQIDSHEEHTASDDGLREATVSGGHDERPELPLAPQLAVDLNEHHRAWDRDEHGSDDQAHDVNGELRSAEGEYEDPYYASEEDRQDNEVPRVRRRSLTLVMPILSLVLVGSACAFGYRNIFAGSVSPTLPSNIEAVNERNSVPLVSDPHAARSGDKREIGPVTTGSIDKMDSHEDAARLSKAAPRVLLPQTSVPATPTAGQAKQKQGATGVAAVGDPPPATTPVVPQRPSPSSGTNATDHKRPLAQAKVSSPEPVTDPALSQNYAVQVTSERSESRAQAAFSALQAKYPSQLGGQQPIIRRADLGAAGTYYRALVGSFASAEKAARMCSELKAAGGNCVIVKN
jgi:hypothetical protein